jgi:hypothetical protein
MPDDNMADEEIVAFDAEEEDVCDTDEEDVWFDCTRAQFAAKAEAILTAIDDSDGACIIVREGVINLRVNSRVAERVIANVQDALYSALKTPESPQPIRTSHGRNIEHTAAEHRRGNATAEDLCRDLHRSLASCRAH